MTALLGQTTRQYFTPYLTLAEYKSAPTAVDYNNLVVDSADPTVQDAELANVIARASSWIDTYCNQVLGATLETEQQRSRLRPDGTIAVHPRYFPVISIENFWYGVYPNQLVQYPDPSQGWVEDNTFIIPYSAGNLSYSSQGPLEFGMPAVPRSLVYCRYDYISGYPSVLLNANVSAGASSIVVAPPDGIVAGTHMTIFDGGFTETVEVDSSYVYGSTTVPLIYPLKYAHLTGISVSALPPSVKQAAILATSAFIKMRGDTSLMMEVMNTPVQSTKGVTADIATDLGLAQDLLRPFRRIR